MVRSIALSSVFGYPFILYLGAITFISFSFTALLGYRYFTGRPLLPFKWHPRMAAASLTLAVIHAILGLSMFLGF
ncbi:MAG: hypothetical protein A2W22_04150 [Candidatus Levybacteria bacterium RBG_16_35_11]|nr:MAG: hypothetical protein A2W22_04150 [Candidatus Levybacteria bacterium RBG_16_35_11]